MMRATTDMYSHLMNMSVCQSSIRHQVYQHMYTSYTSVISINTHKENSHPLSQPLKTADTKECQIVNIAESLYLSGTTQK
jgi:hypothetical protein